MSPSVFIAVVGCQAPGLPAPTVSSVEPPFGSAEIDTSVVVYGSDFWPSVHVSPGNGETNLDDDFDVWLVGPDGDPARHQVDSVQWVRSDSLNATVPSDLIVGFYDVEIEGPSGRSGTGARLFQVTSTQPKELVLHPDQPSWKVTDPPLTVTINLFDADAQIVPVDLDVTVQLDVNDVSPKLASETLVAQDGGHTLRGKLLAGMGTFTVATEVPDLVTLTVTADDDRLGILSDSLDLVSEPGDDQFLSIRFPNDIPPATIVAGEPFQMVVDLVDALGNIVPGSSPITLKTLCGSWADNFNLVDGSKVFEVTATRATLPDSCPSETIIVNSGPDGVAPEFQVLPGPVDRFAVYVTNLGVPPTVRADDTLFVVVGPSDENGNASPWSGDLTIEASNGGLVLEEPCTPFIGTQLQCHPKVTLAHPAVQITATGGNGTAGASAPITVLHDDVPAFVWVAGPAWATAGVPFDADVHVQDQYGNPMDAAFLTAAAFSFGDELGDAGCVFANFLFDGGIRFLCTMTVARPTAALFADVDGVLGTAPAFAVVNGPLDAVALTAPTMVGAGAMFTVSGVGTDAWGNPYILQTDPVVDLADDLGTLSTTQIVLGADGTVASPATLTKAGATVIRASQGGVELGVSGAIQVMAGPGTAFALHPAVPWAIVGEPFFVSVQALDQFGNVADWEGDVLLGSAQTAAPNEVVTVVDGFGEGTFTWFTDVMEDILTAEATELQAFLPVTVAAECGVLGPAADLEFAGFDEAITCLDPVTDTADVTADLGGSTAGAEVIAGYVAGVLGQPGVFGLVPTLDLTLVGAGPHPVGGLVVDEAGCGAEVFGTAWAGPDDGSAVGPIPLSSSASELALIDSVTVDLTGAVGCDRAAASFAGIHVRTTAGALSGPVSTGAGLEIFLDVAGNGSFGLDTTGGFQAAVADVFAWIDNGAAGGVLSFPIVGDDVQPVVVAQSPSGATLTEVDEIRLTFSEAIQSAAVVPDSFDVVGPIDTVVLDATLEAGNTEVVLELGPPADGNAGSWSVAAVASVVDLAGNPLSGTWGPVFADYDGAFGALIPVVDPVVCTAVDPAWLWFRPDGDPGPGVEADLLIITLDAATAPAWWVLDVFAEDGTRRFHDRIVPLGAQDTLVWDGRDFGGTVVPNGVWTVEIVPDDGFGNRAPGCSLPIVVANHGVVP